QIPGFCVKVTPTLQVVFTLKYRTNEGGRSAMQRWFKIGDFNSLSVEAARKQALILKTQIVGGHDPQRQRIDLRDATTMKALWERFEDQHLPKLKPSTAKDYKTMWRKHIDPEFGITKVKDISRKDVI